MIKTNWFRKSVLIALLCGAVLGCLLSALPAAVRAASIANAEGASVAIKKDEDILRVTLTEPRMPTISRYGAGNRLVITFDNTEAMASLKNLVAGLRGSCVEKFEIQMMRRGAVTGPSGGIRFLDSQLDMLLIAYVESDVEAEMKVDGMDVTLHFFRIGQEPTQLRPIPFNSVENINMDRDGIHEVLTIKTAQPITPSIYEEINPHRILLSFSNTNLPEKALNQIHRVMETERLIRFEALNLGMLPRPYTNEEDSREYHFVGFPSPLEINEFAEAGLGLQSRDGIIAIYPEKDVDYEVTLKGGSVFEMVFTKRIRLREQACGYFELPPPPPNSDIYPLEDEAGGHLDAEK
ncbi:MAG: hypothetical protein WCX65_13185 [bacterium]